MELEQLRHFVEVADKGSFTLAASALGVNQPLLSRQVRRLEVELHKVLLYRTGRGVRLTDAGAQVAKTARAILQQVETMSQGESRDDSELTGRIVLGLPPALSRILTVPFIRAFSQRFPLAQAVTVEGLSRRLHEMMQSERIDIALLHDQVSLPTIETELIASESLCLITPRQASGQTLAQTVTFDDVISLPLIFPSAPNPLRATVESEALRRGARLNIRYEIDGIDAIVQLVSEGFGCAIAGWTGLQQTRDFHAVTIRKIEHPELNSGIMLAQPTRRPAGLLQRRTAGLLKEVVRQTMAPGDMP